MMIDTFDVPGKVPGTSVLQCTVLSVCGAYSNRNNSTVLRVLKKKKMVYQVLVRDTRDCLCIVP